MQKLYLQSCFPFIIYRVNQKCVIQQQNLQTIFFSELRTRDVMYNPFLNFHDSYYFFTLPYSPIYFTYETLLNSPKTSSNIILVKSQFQSTNTTIEEEKCLEIPQDPIKKVRNQNETKQNLTLKRQIKEKIQKQVLVRRQRKVAKQPKKGDMVQKQGRNSHSNILRKFFKLLSLQTEFRSKVQKIIQKFGFDVEVDRYFAQVRRRNVDHRNYIRIKEVQGLFEYNNNGWVNKITRILFQNYLENYYVEHLLSSKKTDNKSIFFHLKGKRTIREEVFVGKIQENQNNFNSTD